jgi:hypothetical protein
MRLSRLSNGERIAAGSAILLFAFMFFNWYGLGVSKHPNTLQLLRVFGGGNAWQTLEVVPIFLTIVVAITIGVALLRLSVDRRPAVPLGALVCALGGLATLLIVVRITFPPELGSEFEGFATGATLKAGIFFALGAACGIAFGGYWSARDEGLSWAALQRPSRHRD